MKKLALALMVIAMPAMANSVSKEQWIERMETALPAYFCAPEQYFRQCYKVSAKQCEEAASSVGRICLNKYKDQIPDFLRQPQEGSKWGEVVGSCAGEAYDMLMIEKRTGDPKCDDASNWIN